MSLNPASFSIVTNTFLVGVHMTSCWRMLAVRRVSPGMLHRNSQLEVTCGNFWEYSATTDVMTSSSLRASTAFTFSSEVSAKPLRSSRPSSLKRCGQVSACHAL